MNGIAPPLQVDNGAARVSLLYCVTTMSYIGDGDSLATEYSSEGNASCWSSSSIVDS